MIEALLFDKDGTLFDFRGTWAAWTDSLLDTLAGGDAALRTRMAETLGFDSEGQDFAPSSVVIAGTPGDIAAALLPLLPQRDLRELTGWMAEEASHAPLAPVCDLPALLEGFRARGVKLGLCTNDAESAALAHLARAGVLELFDFVAGWDSGHGAKPTPGPLLAFARAVGVAPEACAMVGDSLHDLHAAQAAGMVRVAVLTGIARSETLAPAADVVLQDISQLPDWVAARG